MPNAFSSGSLDVLSRQSSRRMALEKSKKIGKLSMTLSRSHGGRLICVCLLQGKDSVMDCWVLSHSQVYRLNKQGIVLSTSHISSPSPVYKPPSLPEGPNLDAVLSFLFVYENRYLGFFLVSSRRCFWCVYKSWRNVFKFSSLVLISLSLSSLYFRSGEARGLRLYRTWWLSPSIFLPSEMCLVQTWTAS